MVFLSKLSKEIDISNDLELKKFVMYLESLCVDYTSSSFFLWPSLTFYKNGKKAYKIKRNIVYLGNQERFKGIIFFTYLTKDKKQQPFAGYGTLKTSYSRYGRADKAKSFHRDLDRKKDENEINKINKIFERLKEKDVSFQSRNHYALLLALCDPVILPIALVRSG